MWDTKFRSHCLVLANIKTEYPVTINIFVMKNNFCLKVFPPWGKRGNDCALERRSRGQSLRSPCFANSLVLPQTFSKLLAAFPLCPAVEISCSAELHMVSLLTQPNKVIHSFLILPHVLPMYSLMLHSLMFIFQSFILHINWEHCKVALNLLTWPWVL